MKTYLINKLAQTQFARKAIADKADLGAFKKRPTPKILLGIFCLAFSYLIGWPAVGAIGSLAVYWDEPWLLVIGGPVVYGLSHLVFILGMYLAGADYTVIFLKWAVRRLVEKHHPSSSIDSAIKTLPTEK